jgi:hypothetical protein
VVVSLANKSPEISWQETLQFLEELGPIGDGREVESDSMSISAPVLVLCPSPRDLGAYLTAAMLAQRPHAIHDRKVIGRQRHAVVEKVVRAHLC